MTWHVWFFACVEPLTQPMPGGSQIDVHMNKLYDAGGGSLSERDPGERSAVSLLWNKTGPSKRLPCTLVLSEK